MHAPQYTLSAPGCTVYGMTSVITTIENYVYGVMTAGMLSCSHFMGGFAGGQSKYTRVPYGDVNLLKLPGDFRD